MYVTACPCDLEKFFIFEKTIEITSHVCTALRFICKRTGIVDNAYYISRYGS